LRVIALQRAFSLCDRGELRVELLPRNGILFDENLIALQIDARVLERRFILG
jgi:hypothetical protein